jgi:hypothetical protein
MLQRTKKPVFVTLALGFVLSSAAVATADMQVLFNNRVAGQVVAPVSRPDGSGAGAGVRAQLVMVKNGGTLVPLTPETIFRTSSPAATYFVQPVAVTVPGVRPREEVTLRVRVWEGKDYGTARLRGESKDFKLTNSVAVNNLIGLKEFKLTEVKPTQP